MERKNNLDPFSIEQITKGEKLPENLSTIRNEVGKIEGLQLNFVLDKVSRTQEVIESKTDRKFMILGSMAMYSLLSELRVNGRELMILERRISEGKNDMDIGISPSEIVSVMEDFGWNNESKSKKRGIVEEGGLMVDVLSRKEKPHFPCNKVAVNGKEVQVQSAEELIFEKMSALINPPVDDDGKPGLGEVKWGVDIKLIKAYLMEKNQVNGEETESYLAKRWGDYMEDTRYETARELATKVETGEPIDNVLKVALETMNGQQISGSVRDAMSILFGQEYQTMIDALLVSTNGEEVNSLLRKLVDSKLPPVISYDEATKRAEAQYQKIIGADEARGNSE